MFNGLLLAPHIDALFDGGWISFADHGGVLASRALSAKACEQLGVSRQWAVQRLTASHHAYLAHHRQNVFRSQGI